jgi:hypothetical protein
VVVRRVEDEFADGLVDDQVSVGVEDLLEARGEAGCRVVLRPEAEVALAGVRDQVREAQVPRAAGCSAP